MRRHRAGGGGGPPAAGEPRLRRAPCPHSQARALVRRRDGRGHAGATGGGGGAVVEQAREQDALAFGAFRTETMELAVASSRGCGPASHAPRGAQHGGHGGRRPASLATWRAKWGASIPRRGRAGGRPLRPQPRPQGPAPGEYEVLRSRRRWRRCSASWVSTASMAWPTWKGASSPLGDPGRAQRLPLGRRPRPAGLALPSTSRAWPSAGGALRPRAPERSSTTPPALRRPGRSARATPCRPPNTYGPIPLNLIMANGEAPDREAMLGGIKRGVWVTRFWYTNLLHPPR